MTEQTLPEADANSVKAKVNAQFSDTAAGYRASQVHAQGPEFARLLQAARFQGHEVIVDAGCGAGHTTAHLAPHVGQVIAVDLSTAMLQEAASLCAEKGLTNVTFRQGDVETLDATIRAVTSTPIEWPTCHGKHIDAIVSRFSAHHWPNPAQALAAFRQLMPEGDAGRVFLMDVVSQDDFVYDTHLQAIELLRDPSHVRDHNVSQWLRLFDDAGFQAAPLYEWDLTIDFADWIARMKTPPLEAQAIRNLFDGAPHEVRRRFHLAPGDYTFTFACALIQAIPR